MLNLKKRTWDEMSDSDDEEPMMGKQILPVARLPADFSGEPVDGMQYLFMVRRDARRLPSVVRVENPYAGELSDGFSHPTAVHDASTTIAGVRVALPSETWRTTFLQRFKNFRKNIRKTAMSASLPSSGGKGKSIPNIKERDLWWAFISGLPEHDWNPPKKGRRPKQHQQQQHSGWQLHVGDAVSRSSAHSKETSQFEVACTQATDATEDVRVFSEDGRLVENDYCDDESVTERSGVYQDLTEDGRFVVEETVQKQGSNAVGVRGDGPRLPSATLLKAMDNRHCTQLLMHFSQWLSQHLEQLESLDPLPTPKELMPISRAHACWMFALLANVDEQISGDEISNLRSLARACLAFIKELNKNALNPKVLEANAGISGSEEASITWVGNPADAPLDEKSCWIIITAIADFWGQKDLWMDADQILNKS